VSAALWLACGSSDGGGGVADVPADVPVDAADDVPAEVPADVPAEAPVEVTPDVAPDLPEDVPADVSPDEAVADLPAEVTSDVPADAPQPTNYGFDVRVPGGKDIDHVCRVVRPGLIDAYLYVQATEDTCRMMTGCVYKTVGAWVSVDGEVSTAADPFYDYGGNHHNDSIEFEYGGRKVRLYHSFFGFGWRACTPPDCMQVQDLSGNVEVDGCVEGERSIPVQCVEVCPDGKVLPPKDWPACEVESKWYWELHEAGCAAGTW
jgi:hypothetical protein